MSILANRTNPTTISTLTSDFTPAVGELVDTPLVLIAVELRPFFTQEFRINGVSLGLGVVLGHNSAPAGFRGFLLFAFDCVVSLFDLVTTHTYWDMSMARSAASIALGEKLAVVCGDEFIYRCFSTRSLFCMTLVHNVMLYKFLGLAMPGSGMPHPPAALDRLAAMRDLVLMDMDLETVEVDMGTRTVDVDVPIELINTEMGAYDMNERTELPPAVVFGLAPTEVAKFTKLFFPIVTDRKMTHWQSKIVLAGLPMPRQRSGSELTAYLDDKPVLVGSTKAESYDSLIGPLNTAALRRQTNIIVNLDVIGMLGDVERKIEHSKVRQAKRTIDEVEAVPLLNSKRRAAVEATSLDSPEQTYDQHLTTVVLINLAKLNRATQEDGERAAQAALAVAAHEELFQAPRELFDAPLDLLALAAHVAEPEAPVDLAKTEPDWEALVDSYGSTDTDLSNDATFVNTIKLDLDDIEHFSAPATLLFE